MLAQPEERQVLVVNRLVRTVTKVDGRSFGILAQLQTGTHHNSVNVHQSTDNKAKSGRSGVPNLPLTNLHNPG